MPAGVYVDMNPGSEHAVTLFVAGERSVALLAMLICLPSAAFAQTDDALEKQPLFPPDSAKQWSAAECTVDSSDAHVKSGRTALHWHVTVDHFAGEPNYPIGWPRINRGMPAGPSRGWSAWDFLHLWVYTETSRATLPKDPAGLILHAPDRESQYHRALTQLKKDAWCEITIPLTEIPRHHDVRLIQFYLSESNYRHQDTLDLFIDDLSLLRYAKPALLEFAAERAVLYADAKSIPVRFQLRGVKADETQELSIELRGGGGVAAQTAVKAGRGEHRILLTLERTLPPGAYDLAARVAGGKEVAAPQVRLVESPWKE